MHKFTGKNRKELKFSDSFRNKFRNFPKSTGYIQPTPDTQSMWDKLAAAKAAQDYVEVGRLSAEIRTVTIRGTEQQAESIYS